MHASGALYEVNPVVVVVAAPNGDATTATTGLTIINQIEVRFLFRNFTVIPNSTVPCRAVRSGDASPATRVLLSRSVTSAPA